jgi:hypothetical protein
MSEKESFEQPEAWYVLVCSLPLEFDTFTLGSHLTIQRIRNPLTIFDLASVGSVGFREWAILEPLAPIVTAEIISPIKAAPIPGYDALNRCWLVSALLIIRGFTQHLCPAVSSYSWNCIAGHQARTSDVFKQQLIEEGIEDAVFKPRGSLPHFQGGLLDFHLKVLASGKSRREPFNSAEAAWFSEYFEKFNRLSAESEQFRFALEAAVDWRFAKEPRTAISRLWSGIESLFNIRSELIYRISLLASAVMAPRGTERLNKFKKIKKLYGVRSKAVHGESLTEAELQTGIIESFELLRLLLLDTIEKGKVSSEDDYLQALLS